MKKSILFSVVLSTALLTSAPLSGAPQTVRPIVYDVDPPVVIDGKISDWNDIRVFADYSGEKCLGRTIRNSVYSYSGDKDLSGEVKLAWRPHGLYIMGKITDNKHVQVGGDRIWGGDHLDLRLDMTPATAKSHEEFGEGQFQLLLSPGNFKDINPEVQVIRPEGMKISGEQIAAEKTADGYNLEVFIPWEALEQKNVSFNKFFTVEILLSDSDNPKETQQKFKVIGSLPYTNTRSRMAPAVLADGSGHAEIAKPEKVISTREMLVKRDHPAQVEFFLTEKELKEFDYLLTFQARADFRVAGGYAMGVLNSDINGVNLTGERLFGSDGVFTVRYGENLTLIDGSGALTLPWAPDYQCTDKDKKYAALNRKSAEFSFSLIGLLKAGKNVVNFKVIPNRRNAKIDMYVGTVKLQIFPKGTLVDSSRPPQGELPFYAPEKAVDTPLYKDLQSSKNQISFKLSDAAITVKSEFLTEGIPWGSLDNSAIKHTREVEPRGEYILVRDKFVNNSDKIAAILQRHTMSSSDKFSRIYIGGGEYPTRFNAERNPDSNPSIIGVNDKYSIGFLPWCDALSVHCVGAVYNGAVQLADYQLAIAPRAEYTAEFIIVPWNKGDYFSWINQARRILDVNMTITLLPGLWMSSNATTLSESSQKAMIGNAGLNAVIQSNNCQRNAEGLEMRGTEWIESPLTQYHAMRKFLDKNYPDKSVKQLVYFHSFLDTTVANLEKYPQDRIRLADGSTTVYGANRGNNHLHCMFPSENGWGQVAEAWIDCIFDNIKADGIFWDEFVRSNIEYAYNENWWDNVSADINRNNGIVNRKKSSITLLSLPWRLKMLDKIRSRNMELIINGAPTTHTMRQKKIQTMFETGQIASLNKGHLASPVALGDHLTEKMFSDAWRVMLRALDFGSLYCYYYTAKVYPRNHEAMSKYMYPFTPVELHKGYIIGQERIITKVSGNFGWGDNSDFEAIVFDSNGQKTDKYPVKKVQKDNQTFAEVRLPASCAAVIIKR
ncbi:MAG: hypothetical protein E7056_09355 [Lentisphaerae bacterium]|nr:hypothetical protein [Lentisphaerota bacterium]